MRTATISQPRWKTGLMLSETAVQERAHQVYEEMRAAQHRQREYYRSLRNRASGDTYAGADKTKRNLAEWTASAGSADAVDLPALEELRFRSRDLARNNPIAAGILQCKQQNVIGAGFTLVPTVDREVLDITDDQATEIEGQLMQEWGVYSKHECDIERVSSFNDQCGIAYLSAKRDGDVFALMPMFERPGSPYQTKIQLVEAERCSNPDYQSDTDQLAGGVQRSPITNEVVGYHFSDKHPQSVEYTGVNSWTFVRAFGERTGIRNVIHLFDKRRIGQSRGIPDLSAVIEPLKQITRLTDAELMGSIVAAMFTVFVKTENGDQTLAPMNPFDRLNEQYAGTGEEQYKMGNAAIVGLANNESIEIANPGRPNSTFDPFVLAILRQIGMGVGIPYEVLIKHFSASYSAARAAMLEAWRFFINDRISFTSKFCHEVYRRFVLEAVLIGRIDLGRIQITDFAQLDAVLSAEWIGPARGQIDEDKEVKAAVGRSDAGFTTLEEETAALTGTSWRKKILKRKVEKQLLKDADLEPEPPASSAPPGTALPAPDEGNEGDEGDEGNQTEEAA